MAAIVFTLQRLASGKSTLQQIAILASSDRKIPAKTASHHCQRRGRHTGGAGCEEIIMNAKILAVSAVIATSLTLTAAQAGSWTTRWTGPHGGVYEGSGSCAGGACQSAGTFTGPQGGVWHHQGNSHQVAPGQWAGERTITGPGGHTWQNSWTWHGGGS
jgi:hypothetical protein